MSKTAISSSRNGISKVHSKKIHEIPRVSVKIRNNESLIDLRKHQILVIKLAFGFWCKWLQTSPQKHRVLEGTSPSQNCFKINNGEPNPFEIQKHVGTEIQWLELTLTTSKASCTETQTNNFLWMSFFRIQTQKKNVPPLNHYATRTSIFLLLLGFRLTLMKGLDHPNLHNL